MAVDRYDITVANSLLAQPRRELSTPLFQFSIGPFPARPTDGYGVRPLGDLLQKPFLHRTRPSDLQWNGRVGQLASPKV